MKETALERLSDIKNVSDFGKWLSSRDGYDCQVQDIKEIVSLAKANQQPTIDGNIFSAAVPYQRCPVCNGIGRVADVFATSVYQTCKVCNGAMIIPMHIVAELQKQSRDNTPKRSPNKSNRS